MIDGYRYRSRAFSLLEMLLALVLLSILSASLYASLSIAYNARSAADRALGDSATLELSLELLRGDLQSALPAKGILAGAFIADDEITPNGHDADYLEYYTTRPAASNVSVIGCDIRKVEILLIEDEEQPGKLNLVRRTTANLLATQYPLFTEQVSCRFVRSLNIRYYDGLDWLNDWDSSTLEGELPLAVEISITLDSAELNGQPKDEEKPAALTRVFMLPAASSQSTTATSLEGFR